jgi:PAS domain S-box-containing protein
MDDAGRYVDSNPAMCQLLGYSREELMRLTVWDVTRAPDRERIPGLLGQFLSNGTLSGEHTLLCKGGATREVEYRSVANILPGLHLAVLRDLTERKRAEEALRQSEERFRFLAESIPHMVWAASPDGSDAYQNARLSDYVGVSAEQMRGEGWADTFHPDDRQRALDAWELARRHGAEYRIECRIRNGKTGEYRWFLCHAVPQRENDGRVVRWFGTCTDIDERRRAEEESRILNAALQNAVEGIARLDTQGRYLTVNRAFASTLGYPPDELVGRDWLSTVHPKSLDKANSAYERMLSAGRAEVELLGVRKDDSVFWRQSVIVKAHDHQPPWIGHYCFMKDITDRKRAEEDLRDSAARLRILSRRVVDVQEEERRHLARELHDEIGQVLSAISVNLHAVKGVCDAAAFPRLEESIHIVDQATQQVRNLSLDLRPSMLDDLGLAATVRWYADRQAQRAGFALHLALESPAARLPAELTIACFRVAQEALTNVARHAHARHVSIELRQCDHEVDLVIRDDGVGFDPEAASGGAARGDSFGLLGIQERVELLGGRADIRSRTGQGTTIRAWFPIPSPPSARPSSDGSR